MNSTGMFWKPVFEEKNSLPVFGFFCFMLIKDNLEKTNLFHCSKIWIDFFNEKSGALKCEREKKYKAKRKVEIVFMSGFVKFRTDSKSTCSYYLFLQCNSSNERSIWLNKMIVTQKYQFIFANKIYLQPIKIDCRKG